jgi:hypothetical protein
MVGESSHGGKALYGSSSGEKAIAPIQGSKSTYLEDTNDLAIPPWPISPSNRTGKV